MAQYRMIAIDLDGTLLSPSGEVTPRTRAAIHQTLAAGLLVCFATGRNWTESRLVLEAVAHYASAVFVGGAMVVDTRQQVTLHRTMMDPALAAEICRTLEETGHAVLALQDTPAAGVDYLVSEGVPLNRETAGWMKVTQAAVRGVGRLGNYAHPHTIRVGICAGQAEVSQAKHLLEERFGERLLCQVLQVPQTGVEVLEIFDLAVNKWQGVLHVARAHGVLPAEIIAIGDDVNDLPMIRHAGLGVAMGNARPEVLAAASRVIGHNAQEGLAAFLEEIVEQHTVAPMPAGTAGQ
jgi:Cof subfamily protein (haloacid dehalogenase superfamily)